MGRKAWLVANWKMHKTVAEARDFAQSLGQQSARLSDDIEFVVCPPFTALTTLRVIMPSKVKLGAQNVHFETQGAFTGEISASMLADLGVQVVLVGHSERRHLFQETDDWVQKKTAAVLRHQMRPIVCVGEDLEQKQRGETESVVAEQTTAALSGLTPADVANCVIAYEPVWAIGSGQTPTAQDAEQVIAKIRSVVQELFGSETAQSLPILYGGSVKPNNIGDFVAQPNIDGALVGGASLEANSFVELAAAIATSAHEGGAQ